MAVGERSRRSLYDLLKEPLGMNATHALLDELPPVGADLATKDDIDALRHATRTDMDALRTELHQLGQRMENRFDGQSADLGRQIAEVKAHLSTMLVGVMFGMLGLIVALVVSLVTLT